jgi:predicted metal-dependent phosphoesterase TrpH
MPICRFDLHLHTEFSPDCDTDIHAIEAHCLKRGLTGLAVTDHDTITGALKLRDIAKKIQVIIGEEVSTRDGDVVGLFMRETVKPRMSALETMQAIHAQGGLVYLPHPFDKKRARRNGGASLLEVIDHIDIIEIFNGKVGSDRYNEMAAQFAHRHHKTGGGGSDAHDLNAIGTVTNELELPDNFTPPQFARAMMTANIIGTRRSKLGGVLVIGRRPFSLALRKLRKRP